MRLAEHPIECRVSAYIRSMPFLWLDVSDGADQGRAMRARIEANAIAMLSNWHRLGTPAALDPPSPRWLGAHSPKVKVRDCGLWNVNYVDDLYDPVFLSDLAWLIRRC